MPFNGTGLFVPIGFPDYPAVSGELIKASAFNLNIADLHSGLSNCMTRNGQSPALADLPMGGFKLTGVAAASADTEYARWDQVLQRDAPGGLFLTANFSHATLANRMAFRTVEPNSGTFLAANPNGTATASGYRAYATASSTNATYGELLADNSGTTLTAGRTGAGAYLPLQVNVGGANRFTFGAAGQFGPSGTGFGNAGEVLMSTGAGSPPQWAAASGGSVSSFSLSPGNGFTGSVTTPLTTPNLTIGTTAVGMLKGAGGALVTATAGVDYAPPGYVGNCLTMNTNRLLGRTTGGDGLVEQLVVGTGLSLSGGVLACTVTGGVTTVNGASGTISAAQIAAAATAGYGFTPASSSHNHTGVYAPMEAIINVGWAPPAGEGSPGTITFYRADGRNFSYNIT